MALRTGLLVAAAMIGASGAYAGPYGEIGGGVFMLDDVSGASSATNGLGASSADIVYELKEGLALEGGMRAIAGTPLGVGFGLQGFRSALDEATLTNLPGDAPESPRTLNAQQLGALGFNFDDRVTILSASGFYDLGDEEGLVVYLGVGFGAASISDDIKTGPLVHLGARYTLDPLGYVSLRATRFQSDGAKDDATGLKFDSFAASTVTLSFGFEF